MNMHEVGLAAAGGGAGQKMGGRRPEAATGRGRMT
jgi:hypothetical protein